MKVAYEEIRFVPQGKPAEELQNTILEDSIQHDSNKNRLQSETSSRTYDVPAKDAGTDKHNKSCSHDNEALNELLDIDELKTTDVLPPIQSELMTNTHRMDNGPVKITGPRTRNDHLLSDEQHELKKLLSTIDKGTVTRNKLESAPHWLIADAINKNIDDAWSNTSIEVDECTLEADANVISSHITYKVKTAEDGQMKLKARPRPHGNRG